jgi:predicted Rossmann-fold nucleotide-binding protein
VPDTLPYSSIRPIESLDLLSQREMESLATTDQAVHRLFRSCALAVLNTGAESDNAQQIYEDFADFRVRVVAEPRGLRLELFNAPASAFVDGHMIRGIRAHLFSALRDIVFTHHKLVQQQHFDVESGSGITETVFRILRNANVITSGVNPRLVVCWGGHSVNREEYEFSKEVGYQLGLRGCDIATGCGGGAMKGPMKGAAIAHAKQLNRDGRFIGISEPGIIAAESPNPIVNELVILPDIEKRLEAFVRLAHSVVIFPGGVGTAEELMYLLGLRLHGGNSSQALPLIMAAPAGSADYFQHIDRFLRQALGDQVAGHYHIVVGDAAEVARMVKQGIKRVRRQRLETRESFGFNWGLQVPLPLQQPFEPSHDNMASLALHRDQPLNELIANLRRAFSGIVAGNVKDSGQRAVAQHGPFLLHGEPAIIKGLEALLQSFIEQGRMKLDSADYQPCFRIAN